MDNHKDAAKVSSGVDDLIKRLRDEGVAEGRDRAEKIVSEAESRAEWLIGQAGEEADRILSHARNEAELLQKSGTEALHVAARDMLLDLKGRLTERFSEEVRRLVSEALDDQEILRRMILEVAGRTREDIERSDEIEILLPRDAVGIEDLARRSEAPEHEAVTNFIRAAGTDLLRDGVVFSVAGDERKGIRIRLEDRGITVDLSDEAVAELLLQHLQPRFRALLEGIIT